MKIKDKKKMIIKIKKKRIIKKKKRKMAMSGLMMECIFLNKYEISA